MVRFVFLSGIDKAIYNQYFGDAGPEQSLVLLLYLTLVKTQLLQYNLTRDLMLFYHSNKIKA